MTQGQATTALAPPHLRILSLANPHIRCDNSSVQTSFAIYADQAMKVVPNIPKTRGPATTTNGRLTRSAPEDVKALELDHRQRQAKTASARHSGISKELASLDFEALGASKRPARASSSRYALRGTGEDLLKPISAGVTKARSTGRSKAKREYAGPGHREEGAVRIAADGKECLICAEAQDE